MNDKELPSILGHCLDEIASGKAVSACLAQYPEHAAELAPLLTMAGELGMLHDYRLSETARQRAHARLLRAEVARNSQGATRWWQPGSSAVSRLAASLAIALFCMTLITGMVAASQPGDVAYAVRVIVERAPVILKTTASAKAASELHIADRRLADVDRYLAATGQVENQAVAALLSGDQAAADRAVMMPKAERAAVAARVEAHASALTQMAETASEPQTREMLRQAAKNALAIATRLGPGPAQPVTPPVPRPTASPPPTPMAPAVAPTQPEPSPPPTTAHGAPTARPTTHGMGRLPQATASAPNVKATPRAPAQPTQSPRITTVSPQATATLYAQHGASVTPTQAHSSGGNPTAAPGGPGEPGGNPTAELGGPGEPGGSGGPLH